MAALGAVLAAVHLLLLADHWVVLIAAWALVGTALQHLLCFYPDRPFALLAAHKKRLADRAADVLLRVGDQVLPGMVQAEPPGLELQPRGARLALPAQTAEGYRSGISA